MESGEALTMAAQKSFAFPIPGRVRGQVRLGLEQPALVEPVPAQCRGWSKVAFFKVPSKAIV